MRGTNPSLEKFHYQDEQKLILDSGCQMRRDVLQYKVFTEPYKGKLITTCKVLEENRKFEVS